MTRPRSEALTLPEIRISRDTPTIPAPRLSEPLTHEQWIELQRVFCDLGEHERALLLEIATALRVAPLDRGKQPGDRLWWHLHAKIGGGPENFRSGR